MPKPAPLHLDASPDVVHDAAVEHLGAHGGEGSLITDRGVTLHLGPGNPGGTEVTAEADGLHEIPFFHFFFRPLEGIAKRRAVEYEMARLRVAVEGGDAPEPPKGVIGLPPVEFSPAQTRLLATAAAATAVASFAGALFGQLNGPISDAFSASDERLSFALALTRIGALFALIPTALADRRGRRLSVLIGVVGSAVACAISAVSPNLDVLTGAQVLQRAFLITVITVAGIAVIEEAPEGARAYAASMLALAGGLGFSLAIVVLPFGDLGEQGWRIPFALGALAIFLARPISRNLVETSRYTTLSARSDVVRGRMREIVDPLYRRRFVLLGLAAFLTSMFNAPSSQLMNKYLEDVRDFSSTGIALFRTVTTAVPGLVGLLLGGRLAERFGRRPVAVVGIAVATATQMVFFLAGGTIIWFMAAVSILAAGAGGIALGTLDAELFATEVRGTSNALLTVVGVTGSVIGLIVAGQLSDPLGHLGRSIALTGLAALVAAFFVVPRLPESLDQTLDDLSPTERGLEP